MSDATEPGWYRDYEQPGRLRYHDGTTWTDHVHEEVGRSQDSMTDHVHEQLGRPQDSMTDHVHEQVGRPQDSMTDQATEAPPAELPPTAPLVKSESALVRFLSFAFLGAFAGLLFGGFLFNAIGAITPVTEERGVVERIDVEISANTSGGSSPRRSYVLSGSTESGEAWKIHDEDAYRVLEAEGYPQNVVVAMGNWTGTPERVTGATWEVDHQTSGARIGWGVIIALLGIGGLGGAVLIARAKSGGALAAAVFVVFYFGPGNWLGYQAFQWFQSG